MVKKNILNRIWSWYALFYDWAVCNSPAYIELINLIIKTIINHLNNKQIVNPAVLDIGCGTGNVSQAIYHRIGGAKT